uniref:Uncharacterized protein n=1 Tax=Gopherus agassizii TaxID=38772 RepID=A0A452GSH6_9SAUR
GIRSREKSSNLLKAIERVSGREVCRAQENGLTLLHLVVIQGNVEKVTFLLSQEANVDIHLVCGYTPLIVAVQKRSPEICSVLIEHGADVNMADKDSCSPLHFAAQNGDDRIVRLLLDHQAQADSQEHEGWTSLHLASQNNFKNMARVLLSHQGGPPLHLACFKGHIEIICLLRDNHAKLNVKGSMDWTPLHVTTRYSEESVVCELLRGKVDPNITEKSE